MGQARRRPPPPPLRPGSPTAPVTPERAGTPRVAFTCERSSERANGSPVADRVCACAVRVQCTPAAGCAGECRACDLSVPEAECPSPLLPTNRAGDDRQVTQAMGIPRVDPHPEQRWRADGNPRRGNAPSHPLQAGGLPPGEGGGPFHRVGYCRGPSGLRGVRRPRETGHQAHRQDPGATGPDVQPSVPGGMCPCLSEREGGRSRQTPTQRGESASEARPPAAPSVLTQACVMARITV